MLDLGGLLFRIKVSSNRSQFAMIPKMLKELVPADQIQIMTPEDWKRVKWKCGMGTGDTAGMSITIPFVLSYTCSASSPPTMHRVASQCRRPKSPSWKPFQGGHFLAAASLKWKWVLRLNLAKLGFKKLFAIHGFICLMLQQTCETRYPDALMVVISKEGVSCMDPKTKVCTTRILMLKCCVC